MADVVLNGQTYSNVEEVLLPNGDGAYVVFSEGESGDMRMEDYDADGAVKDAGGIAKYVSSNVPSKVVRYDKAQGLSEAQKAQARENIGAANEGASGTNPNLLDNWYFANPVNRNGQTEYTGTGYGIDRWHCASGMSMTLLETGIKFENTYETTSNYFRQYLGKPLPAGTYTLSLLAEDVVGSVRFYFSTSGGSVANSVSVYLQEGLVSVTGTFDEDQVHRIQASMTGGSYATIKAAKLEYGEKQTLAHQDASGNWVLNEIPNYAAQMAICAQYAPDTADCVGSMSQAGGTFSGEVSAGSGGQAAGTSLLRNSKLVSSDTTPTVNGEINWTYG